MTKILIIKSSSMGDIIHALPVAYDIRQALPDSRIDWVAEESFADIPHLSPAVDRVHLTAFRRWRRSPFSSETRSQVRAVKADLRAEHYDVVLDIQGLLRSALVARWTGVPAAGYSRQTVREPLAAWFYKKHLDLAESLGAVKRYRLAAAEVLGYSIDPEAPHFGLCAQGCPPVDVVGKTVSFAVNTSRDEKLWPEEYWVELGRSLVGKGFSPVLYWGSQAEGERCRRIAELIAGSYVAPRSRLADVAAGLARASLMVGVDTGLAHLSAALGVPSVGIFVSTPTETLRLIGDGPTESLGGIGLVPSVEDVLASAMRVVSEKENNK